MSGFELSESYHRFFGNTFGPRYLGSYAWRGHSQIPSALTTGNCYHIAVLADEVDFQTIREQVVQYHITQGAKLELYCVHQHSFEKFLDLNSSFASQLHRFAWQRSSSADNVQPEREFHDNEIKGWVAWHTMQGTADLYHDPSNNIRLKALLSHIQNDDEREPENHVLLHRLTQSISTEKETKPDIDPVDPTTSPIDFLDPIAIYLRLDQLILVSKNPAATFSSLNQEKIKKWMDDNSATAVHVCTPAQLLLAIESEDLIAARLMSYQHIWGENPLSKLYYERNNVLKSAAGIASYWRFYGIGKRLFADAIDKEDDHKTIHDLQNRLLNIRLQNELFSRFELSKKGTPSIDIPDRSEPLSVRLKAIEQLFDWWTDFYLNQISSDF